MSTEIRIGECLITSAGGKCTVCKQRIEAGIAVQMSKYSTHIRHTNCLPKTDTRSGNGNFVCKKRGSRARGRI